MKIGKKIIVLAVLVFIIFPVFTHAVSWLPLVPCGVANDNLDTPQDERKPCNQCDLLRLLKNIIDFVLIGLMPPAAAILFVWGGFLILMGGANPGWITQGRSIFWNTAIGVAIISSSWLITNTIVRSIAADNIAPEWWKFECRVTTGGPPPTSQKYGCNQNNQCVVNPNGQYITSNCDNQCQQAPPPPVDGAKITYGTCTGVACQGDTTSVCSAVDPGDGCNLSAVNSLNAAIVSGVGNRTICSGIDTVKMLKTIIANESDGRIDIGSGDGQSSGPFQLTPATARRHSAGCGVGANEVIDFRWLRRADTVSKQACIATQFIKSFVGSCGCDIRQLAAGYNGGPTACAASNACGQQAAANGGQCSACNVNRPTRKWECLWEDIQHNSCNKARPGGGYSHTRIYAPRVEFCYNRF